MLYYVLRTSLSLLMSHRRLRLSSSLLCSFEDIFTSRRFILRLQGAMSQTPTATDPGSREESGGTRQLEELPLEPRSGKGMELKCQRERPEAGLWSDRSPRSSVIHQVLPPPSSEEAAAVPADAVKGDSGGFLSSSPSWPHSSSSILSAVGVSCTSVWLKQEKTLYKFLIYKSLKSVIYLSNTLQMKLQ